MSVNPGTVAISPAAFAWIKAGVEETSVQTFSVVNRLPPHTVRKMLRGEGVRISTAFRVESMAGSKVGGEPTELDVLLELKAIVVDLRAKLDAVAAELAAMKAAA